MWATIESLIACQCNEKLNCWVERMNNFSIGTSTREQKIKMFAKIDQKLLHLQAHM
jgi:hypothetical protein